MTTTKSVRAMNSIFRDQRSALLIAHACRLSMVALAVIAVGILLGFSAADLYEQANRWVLLA
jgi:hypothetical protein